jgi:hypothetical protein
MSVINTTIIQVLPYESLTKLDSDAQPSAMAVRKLKKELYANARSLPTTLGGGNFGHLGLVIPRAEYLALQPAARAAAEGVPEIPAPVPFTMPVVPPPIVHANNAHHAVISLLRATRDEEVNTYNKAHSLERQLKAQLLKAVPPMFIQELEHQEHGYALVTTGEIMQHLITNYGTLTQRDLTKNSEKLHTPWNPDTPLETMLNNVEDCRQTAAAGNDPITEPTAVRAMVQNLKNSGLFSKAIDLWQDKPEADQTLANFRLHFHKANKQRIDENPTKRSEKAFAAQGKETTGGGTYEGRSYCWTHGATFGAGHTSKTCNKRAEGHNENATFANMMGGNNTMMRSKGEVPIYKPKPRPPRNQNAATTAPAPASAPAPAPTQQA